MMSSGPKKRDVKPDTVSAVTSSYSRVKEFQLAFEQNRSGFEKILSTYWMHNITNSINAADPNFDVDKVEPLFQSEVINLVECFIFGEQRMEKFVQEFEKGNERKATKCGGVFRSGDPHYSCRECSTDATCVLCAECFQASQHKNHKYRIGNSSGGGCCDCGDEEAWKQFPHCAIHKPDDSQEQALQPLPADVELKLKTIYEIIMQYFTHYLHIHTSEFHHPKSMESSVNECCTILHNDELHTFDQVIDALKRALRCDTMVAKYFATLVDREGRHCIYKGPKSECETVKEKIDLTIDRASVTLQRRKPLHTLVVNVQLVAFQVLCQRLLRWMLDSVSKLGQFRRLFCDVMLEENEGQTRLEFALLSDTMLWKSVRVDWHGLIIKTFLIDYDHKKQFAIYFIKHYNRIQQDYAEDEHHHALSIAAMTVQIFTVPSIAKFLVFECDALSVVLNTFILACTQKSDANKLEFSMKNFKSKFSKYHYCIPHAQYLLHNVPEVWTNTAVFCNAFRLYAELQASMENLNTVTRETKHHIEMEPEWEPAMRLQLAMNRVNSLFPTWAATCPKVLSSCLEDVLSLMKRDRSSQPFSNVRTTKTFFHIAGDCTENPVETKPVSLHLQLRRLFASLLCKYFQQRSYSDSFPVSLLEHSMAKFEQTSTELMEPCLRAVVLAAQVVHANMWKRNGFSLQNQVHLYHKTPGRVQMYNLDIALLQFCAALCESIDTFLLNVLNKFHSRLLDWLTKKPESPAALEDLSKTYLALMEEFLYLLIVLLSERHLLLGTKSNQPSENIKYEILHLLMLGGLSHSEIMKKITLSEDHAEIDSNLFEIASFNSQRKKFEPKPEAVEQHFNPMCYHLSKSEMTAIENKLLKEKKTKQQPEYIAPPKSLDAINPELIGILRIFESDVFLTLVHTLLKRALQMSDRYYTENIVYYCVYLIALGLQEESNELQAIMDKNQSAVPYRINVNFAAKCFSFENHLAEKRSIGFFLRELVHTTGRIDNYKSLIQYVLEMQPKVVQKRAKLESMHGDNANENQEIASNDDVRMEGFTSAKVSIASHDSAKKKSKELARKTRELALAEMKKAREKFSTKYETELDDIVTDNQKDPEESKEIPAIFPVLLGPDCTPIETVANEAVNVCIVCKSDENHLDNSARDQSMDESVNDEESEAPTTRAGLEPPRVDTQRRHSSRRVPIPDLRSSSGSAQKTSSANNPVDAMDHLMVQIVLIQRTHMFCQNRDEKLPTDLESYELVPPLATSRWGAMVSSCGHNMHFACWHRYFKNLLKYERNRLGIRPGRTLAYNLEKNEFLCPMCGALANATIPLVQPSLLASTVLLSPDEPELPREKIQRQDSQLRNEQYFNHLYDFVAFISTRQKPEDQSNLIQNMNFRSKDKEFATTSLPDNISKLVTHFAESVYTRSLDVNPDENNERIPIVSWNSVASTLLIQEYCSRFSQKSFFRRSLKLQCFDSMCRNLLLLPKVSNKQLNFCKKQTIKLFHDIFLNFDGLNVLYGLDLFTYMVYMVSSLHLLLADDVKQVNMSAMNMRQQVYMFLFRHFLNLHIVQILLKLALRISSDSTTVETLGEQPMQTDSNDVDMQDAETRGSWQDPKNISILDVFLLLATRAGISIHKAEATVSRLLSRLEVCLLPWLRCYAMLFKSLLMAPMPPQLEEEDNNMELLCQYLGIPFDLEVLMEPIKISLLKQTPLTDFILQLCESAKTSSTAIATCNVQYPLEPIQLISLPRDYTDLINQPIKLCPTTNDVMRNPAICLLCGEVVCSGSYCCQTEDSSGQTKGASTLHAEVCSGPCGMFLRPMDCEILLISASGKGCFFKAPYVDEYGETDSGLKRGNPLYLNDEMLNNLKLMWFSQGISETVSRQLAKANYRLLAFDWNEM